MSVTGMKTAVEGILSSRETRRNAFHDTRNALRGLKGEVQATLKGYHQALATEGARQREGLEALRSGLKDGRATLRAEVKRSLAHIREDSAQARAEWRRTGQGQPAAEHVGKRDFISPPGRAHQQRAKSKA